jgi:hypothetical protein
VSTKEPSRKKSALEKRALSSCLRGAKNEPLKINECEGCCITKLSSMELLTTPTGDCERMRTLV